VGFDREERRYNFQSYHSEIESNDVKFLYEVNSETRKLIKRSSRAGDLKERFERERCRRYRLWKLRGSINRCGGGAGRNIFLLSSC